MPLLRVLKSTSIRRGDISTFLVRYQENLELENELKIVRKTSPTIAPHPMCRDFLKRVVVFSMSCAKRDPQLRILLIPLF